MYQVQKRNGKNVDFKLEKISDAIESKLVQTAGIFLGKQMES